MDANSVHLTEPPLTEGHDAKRSGEHHWDDDCICLNCGFDGAEWWHWKHMTYEGKASTLKQPLCSR